MDEINNDDELNEVEVEEDKKPRRDQRVDKALSEKAKAEENQAKAEKATEKAKAEIAKLGKEATAPTAKSIESPGKIGVTTRPVSQNTITKRIR